MNEFEMAEDVIATAQMMFVCGEVAGSHWKTVHLLKKMTWRVAIGVDTLEMEHRLQTTKQSESKQRNCTSCTSTNE